MALDPRFICTSDLEGYFDDKLTGLPLSAGYINFYIDGTNTPKSVYITTGSPPSGFVPLGDTVTLNSTGNYQDNAGNNVVIYFFPYHCTVDGDPTTSTGELELELEQFAAEISAISEETQPEAIHVEYCDASVQASQQFAPSEPVRLDPKGGGRTAFQPPFEWVAENDVAPVCLIYLTDLCRDSFPEAPEYPVLWVTDSRRRAPFGETVRISLQ